MREQRQKPGATLDGLSRFWLAVDALLASCLVLIAACKLLGKGSQTDAALAAADEALEIRPGYSPALYRRSQVHLKAGRYSNPNPNPNPNPNLPRSTSRRGDIPRQCATRGWRWPARCKRPSPTRTRRGLGLGSGLGQT